MSSTCSAMPTPRKPAIVFATEDGGVAVVSSREPRSMVAALPHTLTEIEVSVGDRVVGYLPNNAAV
jgi:acyl-coenzyme A synthetase/AMP-(fatty) acid ligase